MTPGRRPGPPVSSFDLIGLLAGGLGLLWSLIASTRLGPIYGKMFADFGGELPAMTRLFLRPWFPVALAMVVPVVVGIGVALQAPAKARVGLMVVALVLTLALPATFLVAMYLPIFALADAIK